MNYKGYEIIYDFNQVYWIIRKGKWVSKGWVALNYAKEWIDNELKKKRS